jgi:hypothetical protein
MRGELLRLQVRKVLQRAQCVLLLATCHPSVHQKKYTAST